jgi:hypothetical protein
MTSTTGKGLDERDEVLGEHSRIERRSDATDFYDRRLPRV